MLLATAARGLVDHHGLAVDACQGQPPVTGTQIDGEHQGAFVVRTQHRRRSTSALHRRWRFTQQTDVAHAGHQLGGPAASDAEPLSRRSAGDARLGSHDGDQLSGSQPAEVGRLTGVASRDHRSTISSPVSATRVLPATAAGWRHDPWITGVARIPATKRLSRRSRCPA